MADHNNIIIELNELKWLLQGKTLQLKLATPGQKDRKQLLGYIYINMESGMQNRAEQETGYGQPSELVLGNVKECHNHSSIQVPMEETNARSTAELAM